MTQSQSDQDLTAEAGTLTTNVAALAAEISSEIDDLAAAIAANGAMAASPATLAAIASLQATNAKLAELTGSLQLDNQAPPTP